MTYNMHVQKHSTQTIYSGLSLPLSLSRYDVQHACTETLDTDIIFGLLSLSLIMTCNMHVQKHSTLKIYSGLSPPSHSLSLGRKHACTETLDNDIFGPLSQSLSLWRTTFIYRNTRYWQYIRGSLSHVMTYNMHVQKHSILTIYSGRSFSFLLWRTTYMNRNTRYWQYIRASLSLSLVMTYNMHVQKHSILTIYSVLSLSLSLWRTTCM